MQGMGYAMDDDAVIFLQYQEVWRWVEGGGGGDVSNNEGLFYKKSKK